MQRILRKLSPCGGGNLNKGMKWVPTISRVRRSQVLNKPVGKVTTFLLDSEAGQENVIVECGEMGQVGGGRGVSEEEIPLNLFLYVGSDMDLCKWTGNQGTKIS